METDRRRRDDKQTGLLTWAVAIDVHGLSHGCSCALSVPQQQQQHPLRSCDGHASSPGPHAACDRHTERAGYSHGHSCLKWNPARRINVSDVTSTSVLELMFLVIRWKPSLTSAFFFTGVFDIHARWPVRQHISNDIFSVITRCGRRTFQSCLQYAAR